MLKFCVLEKYRLPALTKHAEYLKVKKEEEQKILSEVGDENIKKLRFNGYSKILLAGPKQI